ncbi:MAG: hypothetical protein HGA80_07680 [Candidatus Omnitrophica bacterium]|nr:hypothetical protein [Candidatus Omnitrophota bacterium]
MSELFVAGLLDGLAPLNLAVLAWFAAACISLSRDRQAMFRFALLFLISFYLMTLTFLMGFANQLFLAKWYPHICRVVFILMGIWLLWVGGRLLVRWMSEIKTAEGSETPIDWEILPLVGLLNARMAGIGAAIMAFAMAIWAPKAYVTVLATYALYPGKWFYSFSGLSVYSFFRIILFLFTLIGIFLLAKEGWWNEKALLRRSTTYILLSAFYFAVGTSVIIVSLKQF